ncbi:MAG: VCBS repeat-containing protein [Ignavibacteriaceae bacterium]|nr:VCBS repeat-containing protein [Ignavibacteriaceae bacterium]
MQCKQIIVWLVIATMLIIYAAYLPYHTPGNPSADKETEPGNIDTAGNYQVVRSPPLGANSYIKDVITENGTIYAYSQKEILKLSHSGWEIIWAAGEYEIGYADFNGNYIVVSVEKKDAFGSNILLSEILLLGKFTSDNTVVLQKLVSPLSEGIHEITFTAQNEIIVLGLNEIMTLRMDNGSMQISSRHPLLLHPSNDLRLVKRSFKQDSVLFGKDALYKLRFEAGVPELKVLFRFSNPVVVPGKYTYPYRRFIFDGNSEFFAALRNDRLHIVFNSQGTYKEIVIDSFYTPHSGRFRADEISQISSSGQGNTTILTSNGEVFQIILNENLQKISYNAVTNSHPAKVTHIYSSHDSSQILFTAGYSRILKRISGQIKSDSGIPGSVSYNLKEYYLSRGNMYGCGTGRLIPGSEQLFVTDIFDVNKLYTDLDKNAYSNYLTNVSVERGLDGQIPDDPASNDKIFDLGVTIGDVDESGAEDLILTRLTGPNILFINNGQGYFRDMTGEYDLKTDIFRSESAVLADVNNDGFLDLFMTSYLASNRLFLSNSGKGFTDVTLEMGLGSDWGTVSAAFCDINNDGWDDLYICNWLKGNQLFLNRSGKRFIEITDDAGVSCGNGKRANSAVFADFDNDGDPDLAVGHRNDQPQIFENINGVRFDDLTAISGINDTLVTYGASAQDFNNDGKTDLVLTDIHGLQFYLNETVTTIKFRNITDSVYLSSKELNTLQTGMTSLDLLDDGYPDFYVAQASGFLNAYINILPQSVSDKNNFVKVTVEGVESNSSAIGVTMYLYSSGKLTGWRRIDGGSGYAGISSKTQIFGLPDNHGDLLLKVVFPASGIMRKINVNPGDRITIRESEGLRAYWAVMSKKLSGIFVSGEANRLIIGFILTTLLAVIIMRAFIMLKKMRFKKFIRGVHLSGILRISLIPGSIFLLLSLLSNLILRYFPDNDGWVSGRDLTFYTAPVILLLPQLIIFFLLNNYYKNRREEESFEDIILKLDSRLRNFRHGESSLMNINRISLYVNNISEEAAPDQEVMDRFLKSVKEYNNVTSKDLAEIYEDLISLSEHRCCSRFTTEIKSLIIKYSTNYNNLSERLRTLNQGTWSQKTLSAELAVNSKYIYQNLIMIREVINSLITLCFSFLYCRIGETIKEVAGRYGEKNSNVKLSCTMPLQEIIVRFPRHKLERILSTLLDNSFQALIHRHNDPCIIISVDSDERGICLKVKDNGTGIPANIIKTLFIKGVTGKKGGHGIGLFTAKQIIEDYGGTISFTTGGNGTEFVIRFNPETISLPE